MKIIEIIHPCAAQIYADALENGRCTAAAGKLLKSFAISKEYVVTDMLAEDILQAVSRYEANHPAEGKLIFLAEHAVYEAEVFDTRAEAADCVSKIGWENVKEELVRTLKPDKTISVLRRAFVFSTGDPKDEIDHAMKTYDCFAFKTL